MSVVLGKAHETENVTKSTSSCHVTAALMIAMCHYKSNKRWYCIIDSTQSHSALTIPWIANPRRRETGFRPPTEVTKGTRCLPLLHLVTDLIMLLLICISTYNNAEYIRQNVKQTANSPVHCERQACVTL